MNAENTGVANPLKNASYDHAHFEFTTKVPTVPDPLDRVYIISKIGSRGRDRKYS